MSSSNQTLYNTLKTTATNHILAFNSPNPFSPSEVYTYRTESCPMRFHPATSMPPPFNGPITRVEHEPALLMLAAIMSNVEFEIHEMVVDVEKRTVVARLTGVFDFIAVEGGWEEEKGYEIGYVWITEVDQRGERIVRMEEWLDTGRAGVMLQRAGALAALKKGEK